MKNTKIYPSVIKDGDLFRLACNECGKSISSVFIPVGIPDMTIRGWLQCPECMQLKHLEKIQK